MPTKNTNNSYLTCPRLKGQPKKHITVCHQCRFRKKCRPYNDHCQVQLPFDFEPEGKSESTGKSTREPEPENPAKRPPDNRAEKLILEIEKELRAIQKLL